MSDQRRPIGYWLKELDRLIEDSFAALLAEHGLTRRHWQVLNTISTGPTDQAGLDLALAPFHSTAHPTTAPVVADLAARGWLDQTSATITLTGTGTEAWAALARQVSTNRRRLTDGVSAEEYSAVVALLERMAGNLTRPGHG